jgi:myo-inositol-1-phosphate synthase
MAPNTNPSSGRTTPEECESILPIHPTAARRPESIVVQSENTSYSDEHITSTFVNRGASVTIVDGKTTVKPIAQAFQFQTSRKVGKTG